MHQSAKEILFGLRELMDEADGPVLPTTVTDTSNVEGDEHLARMHVDYGPGERFTLLLMRLP